MVNNIAKMKHYPFKITTAEEAMALLMADNIANPEDLKLKTKINGDMNFQDAMNKMIKMDRERMRKSKDWTKADNKKRAALMKEFKQLEKECNALRDELGLPRQYEQFYKFFTG